MMQAGRLHLVLEGRLTLVQEQEIGEQEFLDVLICHLVQEEVQHSFLSIHCLLVQAVCDVVQDLCSQSGKSVGLASCT